MAEVKEILEQADQRIQEHRTAELAIRVVDRDGNPVPGAEVKVRQTRHDFLFGCNIFRWWRGTDEEIAAYRARWEALFNYATLPFYWRRFEPERGQAIHELMGRIIDWCIERNVARKGHPLIWNHDASSPEWLPDDPKEILAFCDARVAEEVARYKGRIDTWDVTNEATDCFRKESVDKLPYRGAVTKAWQEYGKVPFAKRFFHIARQANPNATLLINDYRKDAAYERLIEQLVDDEGKPVYDAIGIQSHMHGYYWGAEKTWQSCERFAGFGKPLHFTETTLISGPPRKATEIDWRGQAPDWNSAPAGEKRQAEHVEEFYRLLFSHPAAGAISWFDLPDGCWLGAPGGLIRKDYSPKPAYEVLMRLVKGEWWTQASAATDRGGGCAVRAFYGDYEIGVRANRKEAAAKFHLTKGGERSLLVEI